MEFAAALEKERILGRLTAEEWLVWAVQGMGIGRSADDGLEGRKRTALGGSTDDLVDKKM